MKLDYVSVQINLYGKPGLYKPRGAGSVIKTTLAQRVSDFNIKSTLKNGNCYFQKYETNRGVARNLIWVGINGPMRQNNHIKKLR